MGQSVDSADYYFDLASKSYATNLDSMTYFADKIRAFAQAMNDERGMALYKIIMGVYLEQTSQYDSSIVLESEALETFIQITDSVNIARTLNNIGVNHMDRGSYEMAIDYFTRSLKYSVPLNDLYLMSISNKNIGFIYYNLAKYDKSIEYFLVAKDYAEQKQDSILIAHDLLHLGNVYLSTAKFDVAIESYEVALDIYKRSGRSSDYGTTLNSLGAVYFFKNDLKKAIEFYEQFVAISVENEDWAQVGIGYQNIGEAHIYLKNYDLSEDYLNKSIDVLKPIGHKRYLSNAYMYKYNLYNEQNNFKKALESYQSHIIYKDSLFNENSARQIAELETKYNTERKEQQIGLLKAQADIQDLQLQNSRYIILGIGIVSLLIIIAIVAMNSRRNYKLKVQIAEENERQQKLRFRAVIDAEEKERKRIARELHDGLGQLLSTARLNVSTLEDELEVTKVKQLENSLKLIDDAVGEVRNISHNMMPNALISIGFESALREQVHLINDAGKFKVHLELPEEKLKIEEAVAISLYRVIQEIINNALKYSEAENIWLNIYSTESMLSIGIRDDGKGFNSDHIASSSGIGWNNIYSRIDIINGEISIDTAPQRGTNIQLKIAV